MISTMEEFKSNKFFIINDQLFDWKRYCSMLSMSKEEEVPSILSGPAVPVPARLTARRDDNIPI